MRKTVLEIKVQYYFNTTGFQWTSWTQGFVLKERYACTGFQSTIIAYSEILK